MKYFDRITAYFPDRNAIQTRVIRLAHALDEYRIFNFLIGKPVKFFWRHSILQNAEEAAAYAKKKILVPITFVSNYVPRLLIPRFNLNFNFLKLKKSSAPAEFLEKRIKPAFNETVAFSFHGLVRLAGALDRLPIVQRTSRNAEYLLTRPVGEIVHRGAEHLPNICAAINDTFRWSLREPEKNKNLYKVTDLGEEVVTHNVIYAVQTIAMILFFKTLRYATGSEDNWKLDWLESGLIFRFVAQRFELENIVFTLAAEESGSRVLNRNQNMHACPNRAGINYILDMVYANLLGSLPGRLGYLKYPFKAIKYGQVLAAERLTAEGVCFHQQMQILNRNHLYTGTLGALMMAEIESALFLLRLVGIDNGFVSSAIFNTIFILRSISFIAHQQQPFPGDAVDGMNIFHPSHQAANWLVGYGGKKADALKKKLLVFKQKFETEKQFREDLLSVRQFFHLLPVRLAMRLSMYMTKLIFLQQSLRSISTIAELPSVAHFLSLYKDLQSKAQTAENIVTSMSKVPSLAFNGVSSGLRLYREHLLAEGVRCAEDYYDFISSLVITAARSIEKAQQSLSTPYMLRNQLNGFFRDKKFDVQDHADLVPPLEVEIKLHGRKEDKKEDKQIPAPVAMSVLPSTVAATISETSKETTEKKELPKQSLNEIKIKEPSEHPQQSLVEDHYAVRAFKDSENEDEGFELVDELDATLPPPPVSGGVSRHFRIFDRAVASVLNEAKQHCRQWLDEQVGPLLR